MSHPFDKVSENSSCPCCGGRAYTLLFSCKDYLVSGKEFPLIRCTECGFLFTDQAPLPEELGGYYKSTEYVSHQDEQRGFINRIYRFIRRIMLSQKGRWVKQSMQGYFPKTMLEVGAGIGYFARYMQQKGVIISAIEQDEQARFQAEQRLGKVLYPYLSDLPTEEVPTGGFDLIALWHVLEHIPDFSSHLQSFRQLLSDRGRLILALPNPNSFDAQYYGSHWAAYDVPRHLWHFSPQSVTSLARRFGWKVIAEKSLLLDGFYISILSEQNSRNKSLSSLLRGIWVGFRAFIHALPNKRKASSIVYVLQKIE